MGLILSTMKLDILMSRNTFNLLNNHLLH